MIRTYDPKNVRITAGGVTILGFPDGVFVTAERFSEAYTHVEGVDNFNTRIKTNKKAGSIKFMIQQSSPSNNYLSSLAIADENLSDGIIPITIIDFKGDSKIIAPQCWITKFPLVEFGNEISIREWEFHTSSFEVFIGGNFIG